MLALAVDSITIERHGQKLGPYSEAEMVELLREGRLLSTDYFWTEGMEDWKPLVEWAHWARIMTPAKSTRPTLPTRLPPPPMIRPFDSIDKLTYVLSWIFLILALIGAAGYWMASLERL